VLVLGAGVSMASGLPDWATLLQRLLLQIDNANREVAPGEATTLQRIFEDIFKPSPLVTARHLAHHFQERRKTGEIEFLRALRGALYTDYSSASDSPLLEAIAGLAAAGRGVLSAIVTYNYDDLVERRLANHPKRPRFRSVAGRDISVPHDVLPIYHVHGFLPQHGRLTSRNHLVLSERYYHARYSEPYDWSNLVQVTCFTQKRCLFIGTSLRDPNQRRLLDMARGYRNDRGQHPHVILRRRYDPKTLLSRVEEILKTGGESKGPSSKRTSVGGWTPALAVLRLARMMERFDEADGRSFGVNTWWVDRHTDYADGIRKLVPARN